MHLAAACTSGKLLPNMERMEPFNVIYQTAEDGLGDTVKPRLIEAGADLDRVLVIDDSDVQLTLSDERIEKAIIENNARLVIIDPIQAYLGADVDMNRANEVRPIFMRLGQVAQRTGCAILLIGHLNKAAGMQSLQRGLGSIDITADEMLSGIEPQRETKTQQAKDLICALLAGGKQVLSEDIDKAALERGIPGRTVRDAKRELGNALKSKIVEGRKKVFWME
jgi:RecA-family ATPase